MGLAAVGLMAVAAFDATALFERIKPSVAQVQILSPSGELRGVGSGFAATADGLLITNHHVISGASRLEAVFGDGRRLKVSAVLLDDADHDVAVVKVDGELKPLAIGHAESAVVGEEVMLVGSPFGLDFTMSTGTVARFRPDGLPAEMRELANDDNPVSRQPVLQLTAPAGQGNSGGPVVNVHGEVLGIVQSGIGGHGNFTFAVPSPTLAEALGTAQAKPLERDDVRVRNLVISAVVLGVVAVLFWRARRA